jgi:hypothetical protein
MAELDFDWGDMSEAAESFGGRCECVTQILPPSSSASQQQRPFAEYLCGGEIAGAKEWVTRRLHHNLRQFELAFLCELKPIRVDSLCISDLESVRQFQSGKGSVNDCCISGTQGNVGERNSFRSCDGTRMHAVAYISVPCYLLQARCLPSHEDIISVEIQRMIDDADQAILFARHENPFASMRQPLRLTYLPSTTVYHRLMHSLVCTAHHLR